MRKWLVVIVIALVVGGAAGSSPADRDDGACLADEKLVPSCGAWWGIAPGIFTGHRLSRALWTAELKMARSADIVHVYHRGGKVFPTEEEIALARQGPRLLFVNWKPDLWRSWRAIAKGAIDHRIDRLATHIRSRFRERFFLTIHHEPENDVGRAPGFGARDYRAMYRHVVKRLRRGGVRNAVTVMTYMGAPNWGSKSWFNRLYPGDGVVDWVAADPYADHRVGDFSSLVNKTRPDFPFPGFYRWYMRRHSHKPLMIGEWGVFGRSAAPGYKSAFYRSVRNQLHRFPRIKAMVYFESPRAPRGDTRFDASTAALWEFQRLANLPYFTRPRLPPP